MTYIYIKTNCDGCNRKMFVNKAAHDHYHCVLALCTECADAPASTKPANTDSAHTVVGTLV